MMLINQGIMGSVKSGASRNTAPLSQIAGIKALWDLDATLSGSYDGTSQTWANLIAAPDDGAAQTDYDFYRGATGSSSTDDPTFNGTANDAAAYFNMDGGDFFQIVAGNTPYLRDMHKNAGSGPATIIIAQKTRAAASPNSYAFGAVSSASHNGLSMKLDPQLKLVATNASAVATSPQMGTPGTSADILAGVAFDRSVSITAVKGFVNARTFTGVTMASNPGTTNATNPYQIGAGGGGLMAPSGTRFYGCYGFAKSLSDAELAAVIDVLNSRHGRVYA